MPASSAVLPLSTPGLRSTVDAECASH